MGRALHTDLYELNMVASYLKRGMAGPATFSLFVRSLPPQWGFLVACGLEQCLQYLEDVRFSEEDLEYLRRECGYDEETLRGFAELRFTGSVRALPEGTIVFADEPLLEVTAPLPEAQLAETILLNQITYQTAVASKAARCRLAAPDADMVDFSFRRVHGVEASIGVARAATIAGFSATSNVEAARLLGLRTTGTMAHSFVEAFPTELEAFRAFADDFPKSVVLLVDTYDSRRGIEHAVTVARELERRGGRLAGVRIDSGDLAVEAIQARTALDAAGFRDVRIVASGGLDEHAIARLARAGAPIDAYGVGTKMGVAEDAAVLESVYKLVSYEGEAVAKLSAEKTTLPGPKQVWRLPGMSGDVIGLADEEGPAGAEPLLVEVMRDGSRVLREELPDAAARLAAQLAALPAGLRSLEAERYPVRRSDALTRLAGDVARRIRARELGEANAV